MRHVVRKRGLECGAGREEPEDPASQQAAGVHGPASAPGGPRGVCRAAVDGVFPCMWWSGSGIQTVSQR